MGLGSWILFTVADLALPVHLQHRDRARGRHALHQVGIASVPQLPSLIVSFSVSFSKLPLKSKQLGNREGAKVVGGDVAPSKLANDPVDTVVCDVTKVRALYVSSPPPPRHEPPAFNLS